MVSPFKRKRGFLSFLISDTVKKSLKKGNLKETIEAILVFLKESTQADYIAITIWDTERDIPYFHKYIADDLKLPPAKPGRGPLGICMETKKPIYGQYKNFPKGSKRLKEKIGPVLCIPVEIPQENLVGAIGIGKHKDKKPFTVWEDANLRIASNVISSIISVSILQDLLEKERKASTGLIALLSSVMEATNLHERLTRMLNTTKEIFEADFAAIGRINEKEKKVRILLSLGLEMKKDIDMGKGVFGTTAVTQRPMLFRRYPDEIIPPGYEEQAKLVGSVMVTPVFTEGKPEFLIAVARKRNAIPFTREDLYLFSIFQKAFGFALSFIEHEEEREHLLNLKARISKMDSLGILASGIAHDFNNIINIIMGYAQIGAETTKEEETKEILKLIFNQCKLAANLTSQILLITREDTKQFQVINIKPVVKGIVKMLQRTLPENINLVFEDDGNVEYNIIGNPSQIQTIILNLSANAKDAMPDGGTLKISLKKRKTPPKFGIESENCIVIEVEDTGKGIAPEIIDKIFDPFFTTKEPGKGTGLGLAQVHSVVTALGGIIDVESEIDKGTKFVVYLPEAETEVIEKSLYEGEPKIKGVCKKALIVEDNEDLLEVMERMLKKMSIDTIKATDPRKALSIFEKEKDIELLITDVVMPHMSGIELAKALKEKKPDLKVIFITGHTDKVSVLTDYIKSHKAEILLKPFSMSDIAASIERLFAT